MAAGKSDEEILQHMADRYGDYVLYKPPVAPRTWLLWAAPMLLLLGGGIARGIRDRAQIQAAGYRSCRSRPGCLVTGFIIACAAMIAAALLWILLPLLRHEVGRMPSASRKERRISAIAVALFVPALAVALYVTLSKWDWNDERRPSRRRAADGRAARASSKAKLAENPNDVERLAAARPLVRLDGPLSARALDAFQKRTTNRRARTSRRSSASAKRSR